MSSETNKAELRAWMNRWEVVNEAKREELRNTPIATKFRQLAAAMRLGRAFGWHKTTEDDVQEVRDLWIRLKNAHCNAR